MKESKTVYLKNGKTWEHFYTSYCREMIYTDLAKDLARRFLFGFPNKRVIHKNLGNGTRVITVYDGKIYKNVYTVEWC